MAATRERRRVLCISPYPASAPSVHHRIMALAALWADHGIDVTLWPFMSERFYGIRRRFGVWATLTKAVHFVAATLRLAARMPRIRGFDHVIIHREAFPLGPPIVEELIARLHPSTFFDLDDAMWHSPSREVNQRAVLWHPQRVARVMAAVDVVVAGNDYIRDYAARVSDRVVVVPTTYDDLQCEAAVPKTGRVVVVWIGNLGNAAYLQLVLGALEQAAGRHPFVLRLIGGADIHRITSDCIDIEYCEWRRDRESDWLRGSDIGIMPLGDEPFVQGKCAFKIIQYFSAGLPAVASPVGMNRDVIAHGTNGFLAATADEWSEAITTLVADAGRRRAMAAAARERYLSEFTRQAAADSWLELLQPTLPAATISMRAGARPASGRPGC